MTAFARVESDLRLNYGRTDGFDSFPNLLGRAAGENAVIEREQQFLRTAADLRNLLSHNREDNLHWAEPSEAVIRRLEGIAEELQQTPTIFEVFGSAAKGPVKWVRGTDPLRRALGLLHEGEISQLPVYEGRRFAGLLTGKTVARWAAQHAQAECLPLDLTVREALRSRDPQEYWRFMAAGDPASEVMPAFARANAQGQRLTALLLTESGQPDDRLLGIITVYDLPRLSGL